MPKQGHAVIHAACATHNWNPTAGKTLNEGTGVGVAVGADSSCVGSITAQVYAVLQEQQHWLIVPCSAVLCCLATIDMHNGVVSLHSRHWPLKQQQLSLSAITPCGAMMGDAMPQWASLAPGGA